MTEDEIIEKNAVKIERALRNTYRNGYSAACAKGKAYREAEYKRGKEDGIAEANSGGFACGYDYGLEDAFKVMKRLCGSTVDGGLSSSEVREIFGCDHLECIDGRFTITEIAGKIKEYDMNKQFAAQKKEAEDRELHVGDEVLDCSDNPCVTTNMDTHIHVIYRNGKTHKWPMKAKFTKTGKWFVIPNLEDLSF